MALGWAKKLFSWLKKSEDPPFLIAKKPGIKLNDNDKLDIPMICPMCQTHWADATVYLGANVSPENFRVKEQFKSYVKIEPGKKIHCPACQYTYTGWAVHASILAALNRKQLEENTHGGFHKFGSSGE